MYSSGSRRRGSVGEAVVQEQLAPISVARKPLTKCPTQVGEKAGLKWVGPTGEKQIHETVSIPNMNDILAIMQKDILGLEKQIPWNCLVKSWKMRRANWRKAVKESCTVLVCESLSPDFVFLLHHMLHSDRSLTMLVVGSFLLQCVLFWVPLYCKQSSLLFLHF